jgi:FMN-dependent NADH-azoreductase
MSKLLRVDASSRLADSHSRALADQFVERWRKTHPGGEVVIRDLVQEPLPHIANDTISGFYTPKADHDPIMRQATELSDRLIAEIKTADMLLIDTPMYNFSIPSALKAWIDQVVRIGETFAFSPENGFEGLVKGKPAYVITATGAAFSNEALRPMDFLTPYLTALLGFLGITDLHLFTLEGTTVDETAFISSKQDAEQAISQLWAAA